MSLERAQDRMEKEDREMVEDLTSNVFEWPRYLDVMSEAIRNILETFREMEENARDAEMKGHYRDGRRHMEKMLRSNENTISQYEEFNDSDSAGAL